jgi:hypothetical protein
MWREETEGRLNSETLATMQFRNCCLPVCFQKRKFKIYKAIIPYVLYACEAWSVTLSKENRFRVFENRALSRIFRPQRDEVTGSWRKLHIEELHNL